MRARIRRDALAAIRDGVLIPGLKALERRFAPAPSAS